MSRTRIQNDGHCNQEWDLCSPSDIQASQYTQLISDLLSGQAASATTLGYVQPSRVPNGVYDASVDTDRREYDIGYVPPTPRPTSAPNVASADVASAAHLSGVIAVAAWWIIA